MLNSNQLLLLTQLINPYILVDLEYLFLEDFRMQAIIHTRLIFGAYYITQLRYLSFHVSVL